MTPTRVGTPPPAPSGVGEDRARPPVLDTPDPAGGPRARKKKVAASIAEQVRANKDAAQIIARAEAASASAARAGVTLPVESLLDAPTGEDTPEPPEVEIPPAETGEEPRPPPKKRSWAMSKYLDKIEKAIVKELLYQARDGWINTFKNSTEIKAGKRQARRMSMTAALLQAQRYISLARLAKKVGCSRQTVSHVVNHLLPGLFRHEKQPPPKVNAQGQKVWQPKPMFIANPFILQKQKAPDSEIKAAWTRLRSMGQVLKAMLIENGYDMPRWGQKLVERYQRRDRMRAEKAQAAASPKYAIQEPDPDAFDPEVAARGAAFFTKIQVKFEPG